jgi:3,4-dihydroxy-9,10-secoandrosta-1,3,5(10)-triene-9,17-dione 4,5-dioxygenase
MTGGRLLGLGYVVWRSRSPEGLHRFLAQGLGMQPTAPAGGTAAGPAAYRMDARACRWLVVPDAEDGLEALGLEVSELAALNAIGDRLSKKGLGVEVGTHEACTLRAVDAMLRVADPAGHVIELFWSPREVAEPFVSPAGCAFVTGALGSGHLVLSTPSLEASEGFYVEALGFRRSDTLRLSVTDIRFLRCNPRHHTVALAGLPGRPQVLHAMVEMTTLDAVGYAQDRLEALGFTLRRTLGRHSNDHMISFYADGPSGLQMEIGWGGRQVDEATWSESRISTTSLWGHHELSPRTPR